MPVKMRVYACVFVLVGPGPVLCDLQHMQLLCHPGSYFMWVVHVFVCLCVCVCALYVCLSITRPLGGSGPMRKRFTCAACLCSSFVQIATTTTQTAFSFSLSQTQTLSLSLLLPECLCLSLSPSASVSVSSTSLSILRFIYAPSFSHSSSRSVCVSTCLYVMNCHRAHISLSAAAGLTLDSFRVVNKDYLLTSCNNASFLRTDYYSSTCFTNNIGSFK